MATKTITMSPLVVDQEDDHDLWEVINTSDGDYSAEEDSFSVDSVSDDDVISLDGDASISDDEIPDPPIQTLIEIDSDDLAADLDVDGGELAADLNLDDCELAADLDLGGDVDDVIRDEVDEKDLGCDKRRMVLLCGDALGGYVDHDGCYEESYGVHDVVDDEDEDDDDGGEYDDSYDLEEELVPRSVCKKVGRERMRKLGKRGIGKVKSSPYTHLKHAFVRGKLFRY